MYKHINGRSFPFACHAKAHECCIHLTILGVMLQAGVTPSHPTMCLPILYFYRKQLFAGSFRWYYNSPMFTIFTQILFPPAPVQDLLLRSVVVARTESPSLQGTGSRAIQPPPASRAPLL